MICSDDAMWINIQAIVVIPIWAPNDKNCSIKRLIKPSGTTSTDRKGRFFGDAGLQPSRGHLKWRLMLSLNVRPGTSKKLLCSLAVPHRCHAHKSFPHSERTPCRISAVFRGDSSPVPGSETYLSRGNVPLNRASSLLTRVLKFEYFHKRETRNTISKLFRLYNRFNSPSCFF